MLDKLKLLENLTANNSFTNVTKELRLYSAIKHYRANQEFVLFVASNAYNARKIYDSLINVINSEELYLYLNDEFVTSKVLASSGEYRYERIKTLLSSTSKKAFIVTHTLAYLKPVFPKEKWQNNIITITKDTVIDRDELVKKLISFGYTKNYQVEGIGDFSTKGYTLDLYGIDELPYRLYFFDDEIEEIKTFDIESQRTINVVESFNIHPLYEFFLESDEDITDIVKANSLEELYDTNFFSLENYLTLFTKSTLSDFFNAKVFIDDYERSLDNYYTYLEEYKEMLLVDSEVHDNFLDFETTLMLENKLTYFSNNALDFIKSTDISSSEIIEYNGKTDTLKQDLIKNKTYKVIEHSKNIANILNNIGLAYNLIDNLSEAKKEVINVINSNTSQSFNIQNEIFYLSPSKIFKKLVLNTSKTKIKDTKKIESIDEISINDYVVHIDYGIGIYKGIKELDLNGIKSDYIHIIYQDSESLYVPVDKFSYIMKYASGDSVIPKINSINSKSWAKTKAKARVRIKKLAVNLVEIYSKRKASISFACEADTYEQALFEKDFGYTLTIDQVAAVKDIKKDLEANYPMDRLLCGDVGFGKTEVAAIASFKMITNLKQVVYLCPTTILSNQHYKTLKPRFEKYGFRVELVNRFVSSKKQREIIKDLKDGKVHLLIGTHRVLNKVFEYCDLGLLIIDEEQRFGVNQKEVIKEMKADIDVLTLSATPIPRTLQMSMMGIKDVSLINTAPKNRYPVQTYVMSFDKLLIKTTISRELARMGQVFYLHNNVERLDEKALMLKSLLPDAKIAVIHGQMSSNELEDKMSSFINKEYDILVCTTIIETGIDVGNANTLIIDGAQNFGLSQLYQIRGRVGRSDRIAYCYLLTTKDKTLTDVQDKRLVTIKEFTSLGSGYKIANRDLSIRGAGDVLGAEQSGFINDIGVELYFEMLDEEVQIAKGTYKEKEIDIVKQVIVGNKHIKDDYVSDDPIKLKMHKDIYNIMTKEDYYNLIDYFSDRFGSVDKETIEFMQRTLFNRKLTDYDAKLESNGYQFIEFSFSKSKSEEIDGEKLLEAMVKTSNYINLSYRLQKIYIKVDKSALKEDYLLKIIDFLDEYASLVA